MWFLYNQSSIIYITKLNGGWFGKIMDCLFGDLIPRSQQPYVDCIKYICWLYSCVFYIHMKIKIYRSIIKK